MVIRSAHNRFGNVLAPADAIPTSSKTNLWNARAINPGANDPDKATVYNRVHATVVAQTLTNSLTPAAITNLDRSKHLFTFVESDGSVKQDGPTMLLLLLRKVDPTTTVSTENHKKAIESAKMQKFNNEVPLLISYIDDHHKAILDNGGSYDDETLRRHAISALTSGPNAAFNKFMEDIECDIESGIGMHATISARDLFVAAEKYYNNLISKEKWIKVDPKDARIMALTAELNQLKGGKAGGNDGKKNNAGGSGGVKFYGLQVAYREER